MAQLGSGNGTSYPQAIDSRQTFRNGTTPAPDSDTRLDSEVINDGLAAQIAMQTTLGANPQGVFGSVAARLNQFMPGGGVSPGVIALPGASTVSIPGAVHRQGTATLLYQVYDASLPAHALSPGAFSVSVSQATYDVLLTFGGPQVGFVVLSAGSPLYRTTFTAVTSLTILGTVHQLGTAALLYQLYDAADPANVLEPATFTVHPSTLDVTVTFATAQSGSLILSAAGPRSVTTFTSQTTVTVLGTTHGLNTQALLFQIYDAATPRAPVEPQSFTVHPVTYDVTVTFGTAQSGTLLLVAVPGGTGTDFEIRDAGIVNTSATLVKSTGGTLVLQQGTGNHVYVRNRQGTPVVDIDNTGRLGLGMTNPTFQLQLPIDSAAKPGTNLWTIASDARLKEVLCPFTDGLEVLLNLAAVVFRYNGKAGTPRTKQEEIGYLAQDVQTIAPYMVRTHKGRLDPADPDETDILDFNGHALIYIVVNALQTVHARQEAQQLRQDGLEARLQALEAAVAGPSIQEEKS